jgi:hypothetical protein
LKDFQRVGSRVLGNELIEGAIDNPLRHTLVATLHDRVHQARNQRAVKFRVFDYGPTDCSTTS